MLVEQIYVLQAIGVEFEDYFQGVLVSHLVTILPLTAAGSLPPPRVGPERRGNAVHDLDAGATMAKLIYASNLSIDGWTEDADGGFNWAPPDDEVFASITGIMASAGMYLYGRRMYETLAPWETDPALAARSDLTAAYARVWQAADKIVYSSTLAAPLTTKTRIVRDFDADAVRELKATATGDLLVGGPHLAAQAFAAGLVSELDLFVWPVILGGRNPALPPNVRLDLELLDEHRFSSGAVHLRYRVR